MNRIAEQAEPSRYCLKCRYCINFLVQNKCPECGRVFDPADSKTFSQWPRPKLLPRWETVVACLMLILLFYCSWNWYEIQDVVFGRRTTDRWRGSHEYARTLVRFHELREIALYVVLIPIFLISGLRVRPRLRSTIIFSAICFTLYCAWPATWMWFVEIPSVISELFRIDAYLDSRGGHP